MFELLKDVIPYITPVFVISTMLNVGLTQNLSSILHHLRNYRFVLKMLLANFVGAPLVMFLILYIAPFDADLKAGLLIFSLCAGAPFLVKLTEVAEHNLALGAAVMMLLTVATVIYVPIVLPLILSDLTVDGGAIARTLGLQMLLPVAIGMLCVKFFPVYVRRVQPTIGLIGNIALYILVGATLIGYAANMFAIVGTGAILASLIFIAVTFGLGYLAGLGRDHLEDVGGLGTAQRNTAAGMIIATQNFGDYPDVLVMITLTNTLTLLVLMFTAKRLRHDNEVPG